MMNKFYVPLLCSACLLATVVHAQDPSFSQFFSSPLNVNPALTGNVNGDWRLISNLRNQWMGQASPYTTGTISFDTKVFQRKVLNVPENDNTFAIGGMLMYDRAMGGTVKSTYASINTAYSITVANNDVARHKVTAGFGTTYGKRAIEYDKLDFEEQFTGSGFNTNLPTGETALSNMKAFYSANAGITYCIQKENSNFDIGIAAFHVNKPKQTFLEDAKQTLAIRNVVHANYEKYLNERLVLNTNAIYQFQSKAEYLSVGGSLGYIVPGEDKVIVNGGVWLWAKTAVVPYFGFTYKDLQFGATYNISSPSSSQTFRTNAWEFSMILRGVTKASGMIPCPWK